MHGSMMIVAGAQWGDEGKGKIVDLLAEHCSQVLRYQGGANAGHTLNVQGKKHVLHLIPSGALHAHTQCLIGPQVVIDPEQLLQEVTHLQVGGFLQTPNRLKVSSKATLVLPYYKLLDQAREDAAGKNKIGTTKRGIGPAYAERALRRALLVGDLFEPQTLKRKLQQQTQESLFLLKNFYKKPYDTLDRLLEQCAKWRTALEPYVCEDVSLLVHQSLQEGNKVLIEGAQGSLLDLYYGTYPFVTSSSTLAGSAFGALGVGTCPNTTVLGVAKAYATRVGEGPFPTELDADSAAALHLFQKGEERGSTTGRPRRCGWLDLDALKYAARINAITQLAITKLDVLSGLQELWVRLGGEKVPMDTWQEDLSRCSKWSELPAAAKGYLNFIQKHIGLEIGIVSCGPGREQILLPKHQSIASMLTQLQAQTKHDRTGHRIRGQVHKESGLA